MAGAPRSTEEAAPHAQTPAGSRWARAGRARAARRIEFDIAPVAIVKVLGTLAVLWIIGQTAEVLLWIAIALMFAATFSPLVRRMQSRIGRGGATAVIVVVALLVVIGLLGVLIPSLIRQVQHLAETLPQTLARIEAAARSLRVPVKLVAQAEKWADAAASLAPQLLQFSRMVVHVAAAMGTIAVLTVYLLVDGPQISAVLLSLLPDSARSPVSRMFDEIGAEVGAYVRGQLITSALAGTCSFCFLAILHVPEPFALACLVAVADLIPSVGPLLATVPAVLVALGQGVATALAVLVGFLLYLQLESSVIVPRIYGSTMQLPPFVVLVAFLVGGAIGGIVGALVALPVAAAIPIIARSLAAWHDPPGAAVSRSGSPPEDGP